MLRSTAHSAVFVSYVREDETPVNRLRRHLRQAELDVRTDIDLRPGQRWERELEQLITQLAGIFVLCLSANVEKRVAERTYVLKELSYAARTMGTLGANRPWFIPVQMDACNLDAIAAAVPDIRLLDYHVARLDMDWAGGMQSLVGSIRSALNLPVPQPTHPLDTAADRSDLVLCQFRVRELHDMEWRWAERGDVEVFILQESLPPVKASLIPSGRVPKEIRHSRVLDSERKKALTLRFLEGHDRVLDGFRFKNTKAALPQVYCPEYDEYLIFSS
jgi:hypothetical protein